MYCASHRRRRQDSLENCSSDRSPFLLVRRSVALQSARMSRVCGLAAAVLLKCIACIRPVTATSAPPLPQQQAHLSRAAGKRGAPWENGPEPYLMPAAILPVRYTLCLLRLAPPNDRRKEFAVLQCRVLFIVGWISLTPSFRPPGAARRSFVRFQGLQIARETPEPAPTPQPAGPPPTPPALLTNRFRRRLRSSSTAKERAGKSSTPSHARPTRINHVRVRGGGGNTKRSRE